MATHSVVQYLASVHFITLIAGIEPSILRSEESDRTGGHLMCRDEVQVPVLGSLNEFTVRHTLTWRPIFLCKVRTTESSPLHTAPLKPVSVTGLEVGAMPKSNMNMCGRKI